jgi:hypothetical protein
VPSDGMGYPDAAKMAAWLQQSLPRGDYAQHPDSGSSFREAFAVYFRSVADAQRFVDAFPGAELADGTVSAGYTSPSCHQVGALVDCTPCATFIA